VKAFILCFLTLVAIVVLSFGTLYAYAVWDIDRNVIAVVYFLSLATIFASFIAYMAMREP